jgi:hypothetical protein
MECHALNGWDYWSMSFALWISSCSVQHEQLKMLFDFFFVMLEIILLRHLRVNPLIKKKKYKDNYFISQTYLFSYDFGVRIIFCVFDTSSCHFLLREANEQKQKATKTKCFALYFNINLNQFMICFVYKSSSVVHLRCSLSSTCYTRIHI